MRTIYFFVKFLFISAPAAAILAAFEYSQSGDLFVVWEYGFYALGFTLFGVLFGSLNKLVVKEDGVYLFRGILGNPLGTMVADFDIVDRVEIKQGFFERLFGLYSVQVWLKTITINKRIASFGISKEEAYSIEAAVNAKVHK